MDQFNNLAAATSTGGISGKLTGRVGDSPIIGSGAWAENETAALSSTGDGENIMRVCLTKHISRTCLTTRLQSAVVDGIDMMHKKTGGTGGVIAVNQKREIGIYHNTQVMPWAFFNESGLIVGSNNFDFDSKMR